MPLEISRSWKFPWPWYLHSPWKFPWPMENSRSWKFPGPMEISMAHGKFHGPWKFPWAALFHLGRAVIESGPSAGGRQCPFWAQNWSKNLIFLRYIYITHLFRSQTDPTQWDHNIPMSSGNSGYLWFSSRCPIGCLASSCMAPTDKNYGIAYHNISKRFAESC